MNSSFKPEELVKVQGKSYPVVGGRLRLAHEGNKALSIETNIIYQDSDKVTIQAKITTDKGTYSGLGNATITRDAKLKNAILELAETRAIARALRFAGYGVEFTGAEEIPKEEDYEDNVKPSKIQMSALAAMALKKGVDLKVKGEELTGKSHGKDWFMSDYNKVANTIDAMPDVAC